MNKQHFKKKTSNVTLQRFQMYACPLKMNFLVSFFFFFLIVQIVCNINIGKRFEIFTLVSPLLYDKHPAFEQGCLDFLYQWCMDTPFGKSTSSNGIHLLHQKF